jgi:hypothetical protein
MLADLKCCTPECGHVHRDAVIPYTPIGEQIAIGLRCPKCREDLWARFQIELCSNRHTAWEFATWGNDGFEKDPKFQECLGDGIPVRDSGW